MWTVQVPLPGAPSIIAAAKAIPNSLSAEALFKMSDKILTGLSQHGLYIASYACDGTETERKLQHLIVARSPFRVTYMIPHPCPLSAFDPLEVTLPTYNNRPLVMIQDPKHALKTMRNNNCAGARLLVLGNSVASYSDACILLFGPGIPPLYHRDVENMDHQDDNTATQFFSASALEYLVQEFPDRAGQIVYLFIFGELVDTYQNQKIDHISRIKMVLRARYFVDLWACFLDKAKYPKANELCKHVFAKARKLVKDFTFLDLLYMMPRLHVSIHAAVLLGRSSDPKAHTAGYAHTYFDSHGADLGLLSAFLTDTEIQAAAQDAWAKAENLFSILGISPSDLLSQLPTHLILPSVKSWFHPETSKHDEESEEEPGGWCTDHDHDDDDEAKDLKHLLRVNKTAVGHTHEVDECMFNLSLAAITADVNNLYKAQKLTVEPSLKEQERDIQEDIAAISHVMAAAWLPALSNLPPEPQHIFDMHLTSAIKLNLAALVKVWKAHETQRAANGVRKSLQDVQSAPLKKTTNYYETSGLRLLTFSPS
ncbi:hypothetical protein HETIRDRAFT_422126 [Heterobasidion irregulare TC 32-1]|uniref:Uncharacterized protein n=1 Tax=Heterobasidion irregulare (strain TC 32-1) TaxID=747525 RepID=W4JT49_HETIT|nr:uncharacterized protein HETIRDRAFT_422126 [Heterobasidion irregulare TC 32-1]ETW76737.1 hypothetical protein HETIRDRAFT_422126 [Heterobasidion irregulare TC 32-1]